ncbi:hypothetical protein EV138_6565 [Kribbella voronezhensis]|uniref:Uncharacterized protein n=1 Tax=Kribbella voronezhensis TaxID=2512212 RepID=A0A4R7SXS4_9ACTN|nr:hypothetical protein [Kribbella voronezhensis]TDU84094.1 hypothetical protein EV138_6565 [Kribbella voronezhensis]
MPEGIDQETLDRAYARLAEYHNEDLPDGLPAMTAETFAGYQVTPYEEWLIFNSADGFTNQTFLVSDEMVYESPGWQSYEDALTEARALKAAGATRRPEDPDDEDDDDEDDEDDD